MKRTIVVTDLTRFARSEIVCTAGIDLKDGRCVRPMPYIPSAECKRLKILPGAYLSGDFKVSSRLEGPHQEDCNYDGLKFGGPCTSSVFHEALIRGGYPSVEAGFEIGLPDRQKFIPVDHKVKRSIITIAVSPADIEIVADSFNKGRIKLNFVDGKGKEFRYISITDLGFHDYAQRKSEKGALEDLNAFLQSQKEILLRVGLSRAYQAPDKRNGYWLQANGIYSFPSFNAEVRRYV